MPVWPPSRSWSGNTAGRMRLTRSGNRQLNAALHRIAVTQIRLPIAVGQPTTANDITDGRLQSRSADAASNAA